VVAQIRRLVEEHGVSNIKIADEIFLLHKGHVRAICDGLADLGNDLNIWAYARVDTCRDRALLEAMRGAGFRWLAIGIESASEHVRADVEKGYQPDTVVDAIRGVQAAGIHVIGNYIFGLPEDDAATMRQTLDFSKELNTEFANFFSAMAYPGSQLYRDALARGWRLPDSWAGYSQHSASCLPLPTKHLTGAEVLAFRDAAFQEYFDRDAYRGLVERTFGRETVVEIARMAAQPLPREHAANGALQRAP
jgi:anaerobic magnesium-protoporphyrin IX monomethyl ester cyclase